MVGEFLPFACIDHLLVIFLEIELVAHDHDDDISGCVLPDSFHPTLDTFKRLVFGDIVDD